MASANATSDPEEIPGPDLQPFFILRKPEARKIETADARRGNARRKTAAPSPLDENADDDSLDLCIQTFSSTWSKIECSIQECLQKLNLHLFEEICEWIYDSFDDIRSTGLHSASNALCPYPLNTDGISWQISTALILTKNIEFVDDLSTFQDLGEHLRSSGCHVANLSSSDFTSKHGISGCLKSLLSQLITSSSETNRIDALASWYCEKENNGKPVILIIDNIEQCCGCVLAAFISMLSEWVIKIPIILAVGVATTIDAIRNQLGSDSLKCLNCCKFTLPSPIERMNAVVVNIFGRRDLGFTVGGDVAVFLRNYFFVRDGTVTAFVRALKIACIKHYSSEPLSYLSRFMNDEGIKDVRKRCESFPEWKLKRAFDLPSCRSNNMNEKSESDFVQGLFDLWRAWKSWTSVLMCLFEVGRICKMQLLDIFCEASAQTASYSFHSNGPSCTDSAKGTLISQAIQKVREVSPEALSCLLETWANHTSDMDDEGKIYDKVRELQSLLKSVDDKTSVKEPSKVIRSSGGYLLKAEEGSTKFNQKAAVLLKQMVGNMLKPIESIRFHEIFTFKHVSVLRSALTGDIRKTMHFDLLKSPVYLPCHCCRSGDKALRPCMHDTSIMYLLAQEHGDFVNLHDWYHSFKMILTSSRDVRRKKVKGSSTPSGLTDASIQARFCKAISELQIAGLLRMPSKRRLDHVQRWGPFFENLEQSGLDLPSGQEGLIFFVK